MKLSKFNIIKKKENGCLIYNSYSGGILNLNEEYTKKFDLLVEGIDPGDQLFLENLTKGHMLIKDCHDEINELMALNFLSRFSDSEYSITIAPTMKCNFKCPYCYKKTEFIRL